eukprot:1302817-Amphidinium_carterae.1
MKCKVSGSATAYENDALMQTLARVRSVLSSVNPSEVCSCCNTQNMRLNITVRLVPIAETSCYLRMFCSSQQYSTLLPPSTKDSTVLLGRCFESAREVWDLCCKEMGSEEKELMDEVGTSMADNAIVGHIYEKLLIHLSSLDIYTVQHRKHLARGDLGNEHDLPGASDRNFKAVFTVKCQNVKTWFMWKKWLGIEQFAAQTVLACARTSAYSLGNRRISLPSPAPTCGLDFRRQLLCQRLETRCSV